MSFLKSLFGGGAKPAPREPEPAAEAEHKGFRIQATPYLAGSQYQLAGVISREVDGRVLERRFVRADQFASKEEAATFSLAKGRQIIDLEGDRLFD